MSITIMSNDQINNLKNRIHNQRNVINRLSDKSSKQVIDLDIMNDFMKDQDDVISSLLAEESDSEDQLTHLASRYNNLVEKLEKTEELNAKYKGKLVALNHVMRRDTNIALR